MNVLFVIYPNIVLLDLAGPLQVFTHARKDHNSEPAYQTRIASRLGQRIPTSTIVRIDSDPIDLWLDHPKEMPIHTLVIIGGDGALDAMHDTVFVEQIRQLAHRAKRICSVCSGALVLAAAGLLDGLRAVTHWEDCEHLATAFPKVNVEVDPIYIKDGTVWTSAGITAGIDMSLAIVEEDLGKRAALEMARALVTPMVRSGGQSQFSLELDRQSRDIEGRFSALHSWVVDNIKRKISVEDMAERCSMSSRNFSRRYAEIMGTPPAKAIEAFRVDAARDLLATSDKSIKTVAVESGFLDDERMRRAFLRHIKTTPSEFRKQFHL